MSRGYFVSYIRDHSLSPNVIPMNSCPAIFLHGLSRFFIAVGLFDPGMYFYGRSRVNLYRNLFIADILVSQSIFGSVLFFRAFNKVFHIAFISILLKI